MTDRNRRAEAGSCVQLRDGNRLQPRHLLQRGEQPLHAHRLHQVVDRVDVECLQRVLVERRGEDDDRRLRQLEQVARELDAVHVGHVDVGQHEVGGHRVQKFDRLAAVRRLADDRERQRAACSRRGDRAAAGVPAPRRRRSARAAAPQPWDTLRRAATNPTGGSPASPRALLACRTGSTLTVRSLRRDRARGAIRHPHVHLVARCPRPSTRGSPRRRNAARGARARWRAPSCCRRGGGRRSRDTDCAGSRAPRRP